MHVCQNLARKMVGLMRFERYVICKKCMSLYTFADSIELSGTAQKSKVCSFCRFPNHPFESMRLPCGTALLKTVELASKKKYLYPFLMYCYLGVRPSFFSECEKWKSRSIASGVMEDVYDGQMWRNFLSYNDEPFLSVAGNLGLVLNFDPSTICHTL